MLFDLGCDFFDAQTALEARHRYQEIGGDDSRYYFNLFRMTLNPSFLNKARERYPAHIMAFVEQAVAKAEREPREARFDLAVASWCIARSRALDLGEFYISDAETLGKLFGPERILKILKNFSEEKKDNFKYHLALYDLDGDKRHLKKNCR